MGRIDVDPAVFDAVSKIFGQTIADTLSHSFTTLRDGLSSCGAMAGTDPGGTQWTSAYDNAVVEITGVTQDVINGVYRLAGLLETTGFNHGQANSASTPGGTVQTTDTMSYDHEVFLATPPPASGGSGAAPHGWGLICDLVGYVWPNGDQDKLRAAASAWSTAARSVTFAGDEVPAAVAEISMQTSPEVVDATQACNDMGTHLSELSAAYHSMSMACNDYARYLDDAHSQVIDELESLLEWTAGLEIGGAGLAVVTAGISEAAANAALAARCAAVAARVGGILVRLIELAGEAAQAIANALARVIEISQKLKALLGSKLSQATAAVVARLSGIAKTTEEAAIDGLKVSAEETAADDALYEKHVAGKQAAGKTPWSREVWQKKWDTLRTNKLKGEAYRRQVASDLEIVNGEGGWVFEQGAKDISGLGRVWDITNQSARRAIEVKSGSTPLAEGLVQLAKDERAVRQGWSVTWQLKVDLDPTLMAQLQELAEKYPGEFNYTVAGR